MAHPSLISNSDMVNGGEIRTALFSNNSQNKIKFLSLALSTSSLAVSGESIIRASMRPLPLTSFIFGCFKSSLKSCSFFNVSAINEEFSNTFKVAKLDAAITGLPPKVVDCA